MKHKHYEMIVAKAANMDLVVIENDQHGKDEWYSIGEGKLPVNERYTYFLCLPQHKDSCLHWLNGGEIEVSGDGERWEEYNHSVEYPKYPMTDFTGYEFQFRIKPKKEPRWFATIDGSLSTSEVFDDKSKLEESLRGMSYQIHEIYVEV